MLRLTTHRGHARQYDLPCTVAISSALPKLESVDSYPDLSAFTHLCKMFACFDSAETSNELTADSLSAVDSRLKSISTLSRLCSNIQRADLLVTQHWMRLLLWKTAVSRLAMTAEYSDTPDSILFPVQAARDLLASMGRLSVDALEAHGPGMELKLFAFATSLADIMTCMPTHTSVVSEFGARDCLVRLSEVLGNFRGGTEAVMSVLRERLIEMGFEAPRSPFITEVSLASDDSEYEETSPSETVGGMVLQSDDHFSQTSLDLLT